MKKTEKADRTMRILILCGMLCLVLCVGVVALSHEGKTEIESTEFPEPSPSAVIAETEDEVTDEDMALIAVKLDETGASLMEDSFAFSQVDNPEEMSVESALVPGMHDERVIEIKERLMEKNYMEGDEPDDYYGEQTAYAIQLFQRACGLETTGRADDETLERLMADDAPKYLMSLGMSGTDVEGIQTRLKKLGYLTVKVTGYFGSDTKKAVEAFQKNNSLTVDGCVGEATREAIYSSKAKKATKATASPKKTSSKKTTATTKPKDDDDDDDDSGSVISSLPTPDSGKVEQFIEYALTLKGKPYVLGGKGPDVFDCSGFIYYALNQSGVKSINYMTSTTWRSTSFPTVTKSELQRGDILCFDGTGAMGHVGIYLGNDSMLDASSNQGKIRICTNIWSTTYWNKHFKCGKRVLY